MDSAEVRTMEHDQATVELVDWREVGCKPIRPDCPAGAPISADPSFEYLRTELQNLENVFGRAIAWDKVEAVSHEILTTKSKHLLVGSYLCLALFQQSGYAGLLNGLSCLDSMVSLFWECLYPDASQMRARIKALEWLKEKLKGAISRRHPEPAEIQTVNACISQAQALHDHLAEKGRDGLPRFNELATLLKQYTGAAANGNDSRSAQKTSQIIEVPATTEPLKLLRQAQDLIGRAASVTRDREPSTPWTYRATRAITWLEIDDYPSNIDGKTRISSPTVSSRSAYDKLREEGEWIELLNLAEMGILEFPFWLDLQWHTVGALKHMGSRYDFARLAVTSECESFLRRLPALIDFQFSDGFPFAQDATRTWIQAELLAPEPDPTERVSANIDDGRYANLRENCLKLLQKGELKEALDLFNGELMTRSGAREQFVIRNELANICLRLGKLKPAIAQFEVLGEVIVEHSLEIWEPELARDVLLGWWKALRKLQADPRSTVPETAHQLQQVYRRLCRLDVRFAFEGGDSEVS